MIDDQNDYKFNRQSTIDNHAAIEWKYCFYQKQWSDEVGVVIQFLVVYKSIVYMQLKIINYQSLTQSKQTIEIARTRSDRRRWLALFNTIYVLFEWSGYISVSLYLQMLFYVLGPQGQKKSKKFGAEYNRIIIGEQIVPGKVKCKHNLEESDELEGADVTGYVTQLGVSDSMFMRVQ
ncbi:Hypothetical_protein [Hexamita inflata]|uniref:Hypothetical_protein n=1 Tax=Hexamita inflata TaxID=28002 RepID=A0AA86UXI6_9EUKA|nr:Hypothetical protein HINF_LOCUS56312 [Hexamita inflata]